MKRYQFRLANVLRVRKIEEDKAALALAAARRHAEAAALAAAEAEDGYMGRNTARSRAATATFLAQRSLAEASAASLLMARHRAAEAERALGERRDDWVTAAGKVTGLEKLDERRHDEHRREAERVLANAVDDLVNARHKTEDDR